MVKDRSARAALFFGALLAFGGTTAVAEADAGAPAPAQGESGTEFPKERIPKISLSVSPAEAGVGDVITWRLSVVRHRDAVGRVDVEGLRQRSTGTAGSRIPHMSQSNIAMQLLHVLQPKNVLDQPV